MSNHEPIKYEAYPIPGIDPRGGQHVGCGMTGAVEKKPARTASPLVRALFDAIDRSGLSYSQIAKKAGVSVVTLSYWKHGKNAPRWVDFENVAHVLGYEITIQERATV